MALSLIQSLEDGVAASGFTGLLLSDLWIHLKPSLGRDVNVYLKGFVWREILRRNALPASDSKKFSLFLSSKSGVRSCAQPPEGMGLRDAARRTLTEDEIALPFSTYEQEYHGLQLRIVASELVRAQALTVYDPHLRLSGIAYSVLESIASFGPPGVTQMALAKSLGMEPRNVFHYVKNLIKGGFVRKCTVLLKSDTRVSATSTLKLTKWADANLTEEGADQEEQEGEEDENETSPEAFSALLDYTEMAWAVLKQLNAVQPPMLRLTQIQAWLAEKTQLRISAWRAISRRLTKANIIDTKYAVFSNQGKAARFQVIRLLSMPKSITEVERLFSFIPASFASGAYGKQYIPYKIDFPLEYQIYKLIFDCGKVGILQGNLKMIEIPSKVITKRIERLKDVRKCITSTAESVGRMRTSRLVHIAAPDAPVPSSSSFPSSATHRKSMQQTVEIQSIGTTSETDGRKRKLTKSKQASAASMQADTDDDYDTDDVIDIVDEDDALREASKSAGARRSVASVVKITGASQSSKSQKGGAVANLEEEEREGSVVMKSKGTKHKSRGPTSKYVRRRAFILDCLEKEGVIVILGFKKRLTEFEEETAPGEGSVDTKYLRGMYDELAREGLVAFKSTAVRDEFGTLKSVDLLVRASDLQNEENWKNAVRNKSLDELLGRGLQVQPPRGDQNDVLEISQMMSLGAEGKISDMKIKSRRSTSYESARRRLEEEEGASEDYEDEEEAQSTDEDDEEEDTEQAQYMDTDEEENVLRERSARADKRKEMARARKKERNEAQETDARSTSAKRTGTRAKRTSTMQEEGEKDKSQDKTRTAEEEDEDEDSASGPTAFFEHVSLGMERAKLVRASVLHIWLCHELFGYAQNKDGGMEIDVDRDAPNMYGTIGTLIKNNVPEVIQAFRSAKLANGPVPSIRTQERVSTSTTATTIARRAAAASASTPAVYNIIEPVAPSILLANMFGIRATPTNVPTHLSERKHSTSTDKQGKKDKPSTGVSTVEPAGGPDEEKEVISLERAKLRWFRGCTFNFVGLLQNMPLYIYMKTIGVDSRLPGGIALDDSATTNLQIKDLPAVTRDHLLSRSTYLRPLNILTDILKQLNLIQPTVTLVEEGEDPTSATIPMYTLNPVGIIWNQPIQMPDARERPEERLFLFEFDAKIARNAGPSSEMTSYWITLHEESTAFLKDANIVRTEPKKLNTAPKFKVFPTRPGFALGILSARAWSGHSQKRDTTVLLDHWYTVKEEMEAAAQNGPDQATPTMIRLAMETNRRVAVVLNYYTELRKKQLRKEAAGQASSTSALAPAANATSPSILPTPTKKRINSRRSITEEEDADEQTTHTLSTQPTASQTPTTAPQLLLRAAQTEFSSPTTASTNTISIDLGRMGAKVSGATASTPGGTAKRAKATTSRTPGSAKSKGARADEARDDAEDDAFLVSHLHGHGEDDLESENVRPNVRSRSRWTQAQMNQFVDLYVKQKSAARSYLDDISSLFEGVDRAALARDMNKPWETLETYLREAVSTKKGIMTMANRVAKGIRDYDAEAMALATGNTGEQTMAGQALGSTINFTSPFSTSTASGTTNSSEQFAPSSAPTFKIELPASIAQFRANNRIIHTDSSEFPSLLYSSSGTRLSSMDVSDPSASTDSALPTTASSLNLLSRGTSTSSGEISPLSGTFGELSTPLLSGRPEAPLYFSEATLKLFTTLLPPSELHAVKLSEASFFTFGSGAADFASCSRAPASIWMIPSPLDPILSDNIKTAILAETTLDDKPVVSRLLGRDDGSQDRCFTSLIQRRILTHVKGTSRRSHPTVSWTAWTRHADAVVDFSERARKNTANLDDENSGYASRATLTNSGTVAGKNAAELSNWTQNFDPYSEPPRIAAILHAAENHEIMMGVKVGSLKPAHRKPRRQLTTQQALRYQRGSSATTAAGKSSSTSSSAKSNRNAKDDDDDGENDDVSVSFQWWREHSILQKYPSLPMGEMYSDTYPSTGMEVEPNEPEIIRLPCVESLDSPVPVSAATGKKTSASANSPLDPWLLFEELQCNVLGEDPTFVALCKAVWKVIDDSNIKPMELFTLESKLLEQGLIEKDEMASTFSHALIPTSYATTLLLDATQALESCQLVVRILGELDEAWVSTPHAQPWTVPLSPAAGETNAKDEEEELIAFQPWTNLDGSLNRKMFNRIRAHVAMLIVNAPGISEETLLDQFDIYRPAVAREMLKALEMDGTVFVRYLQYSTAKSLTDEFNRLQNQESTEDALPSTEEEYFTYVRLKLAFVRNGAPHPPSNTIAKCYWPQKDIQLRL